MDWNFDVLIQYGSCLKTVAFFIKYGLLEHAYAMQHFWQSSVKIHRNIFTKQPGNRWKY